MTKVLHIAEQTKGGVATVINELIEYSDINKEISCAVLTNVEHKVYIKPNTKVFTFSGERSFKGMLSFFMEIRHFTNEYQPDIVHLHSSFAGAVGRLALLFSKKKIVYHPHGVSFDPNRVRGAKCYVLKLIEAFLSLFCNKIIAISEYEMSCLRGIVSKRKLVLATNGVKDIPVTYNLPRKEKLLFIGRHDTQKGLSFLIDYYKSYETDFELHIVGESGISKEFIKEEIPNIKYLGWLEYTKVAETLASYKAVVIPSLWEGFGLVAIEALRSGTPILTSDRGALPYIVNKGDRIGAIFDLESFNTSYPKALNELKSIYDSDIHSRCYETFLNNFTASQMCLDVYEQYEL